MAYSDKALITALMGSLLFGFQLAAMNTVQVFFTLAFETCGDSYTYICDEARTWEPYCGTAVFAGAMVGCFAAAPFAARGRRLLLFITHFTSVIGALVCVFAVNWTTLILGRLVCGLAVGFICVSSPILISEMSPAKVRGSRGVLHQLAITVGICLVVAFGLFMTLPPEVPDSSYEVPAWESLFSRLILGFPALVSTLALLWITFVAKDETPQGLAARNDLNGALAVLNQIYPDQPEEAEEALAAIMEIEEGDGGGVGGKDKQQTSMMSLLKKPGYLTAAIVGCVLSIGQQASGVNAFVSQSNKIFGSAGVSPEMCVRMSVLMSVANVVLTIPAAVLVDRFGRKPLLVVGCFGQAVSLSIVPLYYVLGKSIAVASAVSVVSYIVFFALAYGPVLWVYLFEMFPNDIKNPVASFASGLNWVVGCAVVYINGRFGHYMVTIFLAFSVIAWATMLFIAMFVRETKGTTRSPYLVQTDEKAALLA